MFPIQFRPVDSIFEHKNNVFQLYITEICIQILVRFSSFYYQYKANTCIIDPVASCYGHKDNVFNSTKYD